MGSQEEKETTSLLTSADRLVISLGGAALIGGVLVISLAHDTVGSIVGASLLGLSGITFVALMFLMVGESEDRHYQRESTSSGRAVRRSPTRSSAASRGRPT